MNNIASVLFLSLGFTIGFTTPTSHAVCDRAELKAVLRTVLTHHGYRGDLSRWIPEFPPPVLGEAVPVGAQSLYVWAYSGLDLLPDTPEANYLRSQLHPTLIQHVIDTYRRQAGETPTLHTSLRELRRRDASIQSTDFWFAVSTEPHPTRPEHIGLSIRIAAPFAVSDLIWTNLVCDACGVSPRGLQRYTSRSLKDFGHWGELPMERETRGTQRAILELPEKDIFTDDSAAAILGASNSTELVRNIDGVLQSRELFSLKSAEVGRFSLARPGPGDLIPMAFYRPALFYGISRMFGSPPLNRVKIFLTAAGPTQERLYRSHMGARPLYVAHDVDNGAPETVLTIGTGSEFLQRFLHAHLPEYRRAGMFTPQQIQWIENLRALPHGQIR